MVETAACLKHVALGILSDEEFRVTAKCLMAVGTGETHVRNVGTGV